MKLSAGNDNTTTLTDSQSESGPRHGRMVHVSEALPPEAEVLEWVGVACRERAAKVRQEAKAKAVQHYRNDNARAQRRLDNMKRGRRWSSQVRRLKRMSDLTRRQALASIATEAGVSAAEVEALCQFADKRREERVQQMRLSAIARYSAAGLSNRAMAERLNVSPQHVGRLIKSITADVQEA